MKLTKFTTTLVFSAMLAGLLVAPAAAWSTNNNPFGQQTQGLSLFNNNNPFSSLFNVARNNQRANQRLNQNANAHSGNGFISIAANYQDANQWLRQNSH